MDLQELISLMLCWK